MQKEEPKDTNRSETVQAQNTNRSDGVETNENSRSKKEEPKPNLIHKVDKFFTCLEYIIVRTLLFVILLLGVVAVFTIFWNIH